jgi:hypothetical protein
MDTQDKATTRVPEYKQWLLTLEQALNKDYGDGVQTLVYARTLDDQERLKVTNSKSRSLSNDVVCVDLNGGGLAFYWSWAQVIALATELGVERAARHIGGVLGLAYEAPKDS